MVLTLQSERGEDCLCKLTFICSCVLVFLLVFVFDDVVVVVVGDCHSHVEWLLLLALRLVAPAAFG